MSDNALTPPETAPSKAQKATIGRIVHYVPERDSPESANNAKVVPAMVVAAWGGTDDLVNLKVFTDGVFDTWVPSAKYSEEKEPRTWHWPAR